jgi:hypothetical protein
MSFLWPRRAWETIDTLNVQALSDASRQILPLPRRQQLIRHPSSAPRSSRRMTVELMTYVACYMAYPET